MREQLDRLRKLISLPRINAGEVSESLDALPTGAGAEITVVVAQARRALAKISSGKDQYKPLLRHAIKRLAVLLEDQKTGLQEDRLQSPRPSPMPLMLLRRPRCGAGVAMSM